MQRMGGTYHWWFRFSIYDRIRRQYHDVHSTQFWRCGAPGTFSVPEIKSAMLRVLKEVRTTRMLGSDTRREPMYDGV